MKILFFSNKDLASNVALNLLLPKVSKIHEVHLWLSAKVGNNRIISKQLKTLKFFELDLSNKLLSPLIPAPKNINTFKTFDEFSPFLHSDLREVHKINSPEIIGDLNALPPDLIISIRFGGILKETVISILRKGVINLHLGILPKYKGVMATFWAMKNNDPQVGTTLHTIDDGSIDTGHVVKISKMNVETNKSYLWHVPELYKQGSLDILEAIETLDSGDVLDSTPQNETNTYFTFTTENECNVFENSGLSIVDEQDYLEFIQLNYM